MEDKKEKRGTKSEEGGSWRPLFAHYAPQLEEHLPVGEKSISLSLRGESQGKEDGEVTL